MTGRFFALVLLVASLHLGTPLAAQQPPPQPAPAAEQETDAGKVLREQSIYIPYSKLRSIFEKEGRGVFLPYETFEKLWQKAREAERKEPEQGAPVKALITEIQNEAVVENDVVRVQAAVKIQLLQAGWHRIPLRLADTGIITAKIDGNAARVVAAKSGGYELLIEHQDEAASEITLQLEYAKAYEKSPGQNSVSFAAPRAPVNRWLVRVPESGVRVQISPVIAASEPPAGDDEDKETRMLAFVGSADQVRIDWNPKAEGASGLAALATVQSEQTMEIDEGVVRNTAKLTYNISRATLSELIIEVPADHKVINVFDANVRQWDVEKADDQQRIKVQLFQPTRGRQMLLVELEQFRDDMTAEPLAVPEIRAIDAGRQQGFIVVKLTSALRVADIQRQGLLQLDREELPKTLKTRAGDIYYRFAALPYQMTLQLEKVEPYIQLDQMVEAFVETNRLTVDWRGKFQIERTGVFQFEVQIPNGFELRTVSGVKLNGFAPAQVDSYHVVGEDSKTLVVTLARKALGNVALNIRLQRDIEDENLLGPTGEASSLTLPIPQAAEDAVDRTTGHLKIHSPESLRVSTGALDGLQGIPLSEARSLFPAVSLKTQATCRPVLAFAHAVPPANIDVQVQRRMPHVTAQQLLSATVETGVVKYQADFHYTVLYSGVKQLRIDVPNELSGLIRIPDKSIQHQAIDPQPDNVPAGHVAWTLSSDSEFLGQAKISLQWETPMDELELGKSTDIQLPALLPQGADRSWGQIVLAKSETLDIRQGDEIAGLRPIDPQHDLVNADPIAGAARAYEFSGDWQLAVTVTRYKLEEVKRTSIERGVLRMVVGRDRRTSIQALYRMRSARQRLEVQLPDAFDPTDGFNLNPLRINGKSVDLERGNKDEFFVPLLGMNSEEPFLLELRYTIPGNHTRLEYPIFPSDPAVQKVYMCTYLPREWALIGSRGPWNSELSTRWKYMLAGEVTQLVGGDQLPFQPTAYDSERINWVSEGLSLATSPDSDFQTDGQMHMFSTIRPQLPSQGALRLTAMNRDFLHGLVFVGITVPGVILILRPWAERVMVSVGVFVGLAFSAIFLPTLSMQVIDEVLAMAMVLVFAVWVLATFVGLTRQRWVLSFASWRSTAAAAPTTAETDTPAPSTNQAEDSAADDGDAESKEESNEN